MSSPQVPYKTHYKKGQRLWQVPEYKTVDHYREEHVKHVLGKWPKVAEDAAFERYNQLLQKHGNIFDEIYDDFTKKVDERFGIKDAQNGHHKAGARREIPPIGAHTPEEGAERGVSDSPHSAHHKNQGERGDGNAHHHQSDGNAHKQEKELHFDDLLSHRHNQRNFLTNEIQNRAGTALPAATRAGRGRSPPPIMTLAHSATTNGKNDAPVDKAFFGKMDDYLQKTDKELAQHQRDLEELMFKRNEIFDGAAARSLSPSANTATSKFFSPRQRDKVVTSENELMIMKLTRALVETLHASESAAARSDERASAKHPYYCIKILNLLEREPTMFQDSIHYVARTVERYIFCLEEGVLAELSQKFALTNVRSKRYMYRELVDIARHQLDANQNAFEKYKTDTENRLNEQRDLLEQRERQIRQLEIDLEQADAKCQQSFERERKALQSHVAHLKRENQNLLNEYREAKKQHITQQGQNNQIKERQEKERAKLEETHEQKRLELEHKLEQEKSINSQFKSAVTEIVENYKTAICSLRVNRGRIEELEEKIVYLQQENQRLAVRAGANFDEMTPRPELQGFYDLLLFKAQDESKKHKNKGQIVSKVKIIDFKTKSTKDSLDHICKQLSEYVEGLRTELEKRSAQPGLQQSMLMSLQNKYAKAGGKQKKGAAAVAATSAQGAQKRGVRKTQEDDAKSRISKSSRLKSQNSMQSDMEDLNDLDGAGGNNAGLDGLNEDAKEFDEDSNPERIDELNSHVDEDNEGDDEFHAGGPPNLRSTKQDDSAEDDLRVSGGAGLTSPYQGLHAPKIIVAPPGSETALGNSRAPDASPNLKIDRLQTSMSESVQLPQNPKTPKSNLGPGTGGHTKKKR